VEKILGSNTFLRIRFDASTGMPPLLAFGMVFPGMDPEAGLAS
jgi:hypothetical protein